MTNPLRRALTIFLTPLLLTTPLLAADTPPASQRNPNIILILADDLGYGDLGFLHQNARSAANLPAFATPHLDQLASQGSVLRNHYTAAPVCAPARASLLTGQHQGHCGIRDNQFDKALPDTLNLPRMLKHAGYRTAVIGKWGLAGGKKTDQPAHPLRRGFDEFFGYLFHRDGHVYYHDADHALAENLTDLGDQYQHTYDTDLFTARAKKFVSDNADKPFFLYLAYTAVHNALDVPGNPYPAGYGKSAGLQWPPKPTPETKNTFIHPDYATKPWTDPMKRYATMARRLDDGVHDLVQTLRDLKLDDDTLIVFTSDNGPANEGGADPRLFSSWATFDGLKRDVFEGGVREPTFAFWPGRIPAGSTCDLPSGFHDWMPTLAHAAGLPAPAHSDGTSLLPHLTAAPGKHPTPPYVYIEYQHPGRARNAAADVASRKGDIRGQQQLVRIGDFVGLRTSIESANDPLRLYNVSKDPHQDHDLAKNPAHADLLARMTTLLTTARTPDPSAKRPYDNVPLPAVTPSPAPKPGLLTCTLVTGAWPYTPNFPTLTPTSTTQTQGLSLPPNLPKDQPYGLHYAGYLSVPTTGTYTLAATSTGPLHLWLHDAHLINVESPTPNQPTTITLPLTAGLHPLRLSTKTSNASTPPSITLTWSSPNSPNTPIPTTAFAAP